MPYAPTVNDNSGQILAGGINQAVMGLSKGIDDYMQKKAEKEKQEQAFKLIRELADPNIPDDALQAGIKGLGGAGALQAAQYAQQQKRQAELDRQSAALNAAHLKGLNDAAEQLARDRSAINAAVATPWADQSMGGAAMRALQSGATPESAMKLAQMGEVIAQTQQRTTPRPERMPVAMTVGEQSGVWDGANWKPNAAPKAPPIDRTLTAELMRLDAAAKQAEASGDTALAATLRQAMQSQAKRGSGADDLLAGIAALAGKAPGTPTPPPPPTTPAKSRFKIVPEGK